MLGTREHYLTDCLGQVFLFTSIPQADNVGAPRWPDVIACWTYARYTLEDIARGQHDPFHYRLLGLWLDVFREPWAQPADLDGLIDDLAEAIASGEVLVYRHEDPLDAYVGSSGAGEQDVDSASGDEMHKREQPRTGAGNSQTPPKDDDNPHPGLHNREWDKIDNDKFKTQRPVDMENLSSEEAKAVKVLEAQGRDDEKIEQVLSSGDDFRVKQMEPGDKFYGFDDTNSQYDTKNPASPYWLDEAGYEEVKAKFYKEGAWDREGLKNYLALPCHNRANVIDTATVEAPQTVVESTIGKATEQIGYTREDYSTGMMGKIMAGGGTQVAPNHHKMSDVNRLDGTP